MVLDIEPTLDALIYVPSPFYIFILTQAHAKLLSCPGWAATWDPLASASHTAEITGVYHCTQDITFVFYFLVLGLESWAILSLYSTAAFLAHLLVINIPKIIIEQIVYRVPNALFSPTVYPITNVLH